ncbi:MAG: SMEK domain-containing protein [Blastocatellia bacterium]|nr:SMEK domain-containing protein [Blastocatellia bacterium]
MSNLLHIRTRINELLGIFAFQAKAHSAGGKTDFNKVSEDVLVPLFRQIFDLADLKNLNAAMKKNFPAIDLADDLTKIAFQVTATADSQKIKDTLQTFVEKELYKKYPRLIFYILTEKKSSYPKQAFAELIAGNFEFDVERDILDYTDLIRQCHTFQLDKASKIKRILEANFGRGDYSVFSETQKEPVENVFLNLIGVTFPKKLYLADLSIDREAIVANALGALRYDTPTRTIIRHYILEQLKLEFFSGWHLYKNQLLTFHDLYDDNSFLARIVDKGTIDSIKTEDFFTINRKIDEDRENIFRGLLRKTLQEQLYQQQVEWQFEEGLYIFVENGSEQETKKKTRRKKDNESIEEEQIIFKRHETWYGEKEAHRAVLEKFMKADAPDQVWYCKHRAFEAKFKKIGDHWFLLLLPDWFFSYNGFDKSDFHANDLKWLKKKANTETVFNDFRFLHYFLRKPGNSLLPGETSDQLLRFGEIISFDNAPFLYDESWNPPEEKKKNKADESAVAEQNTAQVSFFDL